MVGQNIHRLGWFHAGNASGCGTASSTSTAVADAVASVSRRGPGHAPPQLRLPHPRPSLITWHSMLCRLLPRPLQALAAPAPLRWPPLMLLPFRAISRQLP